MNNEVKLDELARILGKSRHFVLDRLRAGMPYLKKGGRGRAYTFNAPAAIGWIAKHSAQGRVVDHASVAAKQRLAQASAELKELQLAEKRGELLPAAEVEATWTDTCASLRSRMMIIPGRAASLVANETDPAAIEGILEEEIRGALSELSGG